MRGGLLGDAALEAARVESIAKRFHVTHTTH
jgi:hypothetical protein